MRLHFRPGEALRAVQGITGRQLDYWHTTSLVEASLVTDNGRRFYSLTDLSYLQLAADMRNKGFSKRDLHVLLASVRSLLFRWPWKVAPKFVVVFTFGKRKKKHIVYLALTPVFWTNIELPIAPKVFHWIDFGKRENEANRSDDASILSGSEGRPRL
jgi:hypothetical protein